MPKGDYNTFFRIRLMFRQIWTERVSGRGCSMDRKLWLVGALIAGIAAMESLDALGAGTSPDMPESRFGTAAKRPDLGPDPLSQIQSIDEEGGTRAPASVVVNQDAPRDRKKIERVEQRVLEQDEIPKLPEMDALISKRKGIQELSLIAGDLGYFPKTLFVTRDVPVRLFVTGSSKNALCLMLDSFQIRKQVRSNKIEEITFTPNQPGRYRFYCPVNGMEGTLIVKELALTESE